MSTGKAPTHLLSVTYRPVGELVPDPRNARTHSKRQIEQIRTSIAEFGFTNPILTDPEGHIIAGHGRLLAAKDMGMAEVPVIALGGLSEVQKRALRLADNKIALNAGWDMEILKLELSELATMDVDIDLTLTGFATGEIDVILDGQDDPDDEEISGYSGITGSVVEMAATWTFFAGLLVLTPRLMPLFLIHPTMCGLAAMPIPRDDTVSLPWPRAK